MKVTGFSFVKNALIYDYPVVEAILSILPICDEFVVAVGKSDDATLELIKGIAPDKIRIIQTEWDESLREGGKVLAVETDKAFKAISEDSDWAFYIQGDEVVSEKYLDTIKSKMEEYKDVKEVDGLLFKYKHFYGSYDYVGASAKWYPEEIRVIKNDKSIYSYKDAQGFRKGENEKLKVVPIDAYIYHYGWVKDPKAMQKKQENFNKLWHDDDWVKENIISADEFDYGRDVSQLELFTEEHPQVMKERIDKKNWKFAHDISINKRSTKDKLKKILKKIGIDTSFRNYEWAKVPKSRIG
ncbi:MAG: glycosyltransferase family 2 protein [Fluviicola sp.]|nr:glycosyltransferase family 2 protein [Fluviicola sp.]